LAGQAVCDAGSSFALADWGDCAPPEVKIFDAPTRMTYGFADTAAVNEPLPLSANRPPHIA
jgi:hypothetical protein